VLLEPLANHWLQNAGSRGLFFVRIHRRSFLYLFRNRFIVASRQTDPRGRKWSGARPSSVSCLAEMESSGRESGAGGVFWQRDFAGKRSPRDWPWKRKCGKDVRVDTVVYASVSAAARSRAAPVTGWATLSGQLRGYARRNVLAPLPLPNQRADRLRRPRLRGLFCANTCMKPRGRHRTSVHGACVSHLLFASVSLSLRTLLDATAIPVQLDQ
jgi:hypothetical protein